ncbi:MAG: ferredoxin--NADP reductase [Gammaproteobacteria bacterium]
MAIAPQTGKVAETRRWTEDLYSVRIDAAFAPFEPGQFARIGLPLDGENVMRPYSFVNAPEEGLHEFYYAVVPEGPLSGRLPSLRAGDDILYVPKPNGYMVLSEIPDARALWMLSTGTAVGPFLSILKSARAWERFENLVLAHAVRRADELSYSAEIADLLRKGGGRLHFAPFVSREDSEGAIRGRIPAALESGALQKRTGLDISPADTQFMICGNPQMVKDTTAVLLARGFERNRRRKPGHITMENYW